ncbi:MAG: peptidoglycan editing factor PgeF [Ktedonobacteraceae bacterium]
MIEQQQGTSVLAQGQHDVCYLQFGHLLRFPEVVHGVFTRLGGYSEGACRGLNVSATRGDNFEHVLRNRLLALQALHLEDLPCATLWLVHGGDVAVFDREHWADWRPDWPYRAYALDDREIVWTNRARLKADAFITDERDVVLSMSFADCVPLLFYDPTRQVIGMAHAGWRGTARGIAAATVEAMSARFGCRPADIRAGIAPAISPCRYEVSEHVRDLFYGAVEFAEQPTNPRYRDLVRASAVFSLVYEDHPSLRLDLEQTNHKQLLMAGIVPEHIEAINLCTSCNRDRFFSHRGEHGLTGRFPVLLALRKPEQRPQEMDQHDR